MSRFLNALKLFFKALNEPVQAKEFLQEKKAPPVFSDHSHLHLLMLLQKEGRLIDFLKEDITQFTDAQIGAAVRKIQKDCAKSLEECVTLRPLMQEEEGALVVVPQGYNSQAIKVVGKVKGEPPYQGIVRHKGWQAHKISLPKQTVMSDNSVIYPAEIEVTPS